MQHVCAFGRQMETVLPNETVAVLNLVHAAVLRFTLPILAQQAEY